MQASTGISRNRLVRVVVEVCEHSLESKLGRNGIKTDRDRDEVATHQGGRDG